MALTLWNLFEATLLCINAICVLNEKRFLAKCDWWRQERRMEGFGENSSTQPVVHFMKSVRTVMKFPLILLNFLVIAFKLVAG